MLLEVKWGGGSGDKLQRTMKRRKLGTIAEIEKVKALPAGLSFYLTAWYDLDTCRDVSFGYGPIPWLAILRYAEVYRLADWHRDIFIDHIKAMDLAYRKYKAEEKPVEPDKPKVNIRS